MYLWLSIVTLCLITSNAHPLNTCDIWDESESSTCLQLSKVIKTSILQDEGNLYRMRRAFFYSPTAAPVLLKVLYDVSFSDNITAEANAQTLCSERDCNTTVDLTQRTITYGWTSSGVYAVFHPTVLNMIQAQIPFAALRIVHRTLPHLTSPEADAFLWDGSYNLPSLQINVHITTLSCTQSLNMLETVLMDFNTLVSLIFPL